jgi:hypothetical protein
MMHRTTIVADEEDLAILRAAAEREGVSLAQYMRGVVAETAASLRRGRRPSVGIGRSGGVGVAQESVDDEDAPASNPPRS